MKLRISIACAAILVAALLATAQMGQPDKKGGATPATGKHEMYQPGQVQWKPGPPSLPPGAQAAVLEGDPSKPGEFTLRLMAPDGYRIPPHWHPATEHVTVISGTFHLGMGDTFDKTKAHAMQPGAFVYMEPGTRHYAYTSGETVIQLHGQGPWQINYVNPADDPRQQARK